MSTPRATNPCPVRRLAVVADDAQGDHAHVQRSQLEATVPAAPGLVRTSTTWWASNPVSSETSANRRSMIKYLSRKNRPPPGL